MATFKSSGSITMSEVRTFLRTKGATVPDYNVSLASLFATVASEGITTPGGNTSAPHAMSEFYGMNYSTAEPGAPVITLLGESEINLEPGDALPPHIDGIGPDDITINIGESGGAGGDFENAHLDGVIYNRSGSDDDGKDVLFFDMIRIPSHRAQRLASIEAFYANPDNADKEWSNISYQGMIPGTWNSATQTFTVGGNEIGNGLGFASLFSEFIHSQNYGQIGPWYAPIDPDTGSASTADAPDGGHVSKTMDAAQNLWVMVPQYLSFGNIRYWSTSGLDPREEDRPQDMTLSLQWNSSGGAVTDAPGVDAEGNGIYEWFDGLVDQKTTNAKKLTLQAVVDINSITIDYGSYSKAKPTLPLPSESEKSSLRYEYPFQFSLYQK